MSEKTFPKDWGCSKAKPDRPGRGGQRKGAGRPVVMRRCSRCGREMSSREIRSHECVRIHPCAEVAKYLSLAWDVMQTLPVIHYDFALSKSVAAGAQHYWAVADTETANVGFVGKWVPYHVGGYDPKKSDTIKAPKTKRAKRKDKTNAKKTR